VKGKVGAIRQMQAESASTHVGATATASTASDAIAKTRSHVARIQSPRLPVTPHPATPANPATQAAPATSHTKSHGASFPATAAVAEPPAAASHAPVRSSRHSRTRLATNPSSAPSAITPGINVGSRYAAKLKPVLPAK